MKGYIYLFLTVLYSFIFPPSSLLANNNHQHSHVNECLELSYTASADSIELFWDEPSPSSNDPQVGIANGHGAYCSPFQYKIRRSKKTTHGFGTIGQNHAGVTEFTDDNVVEGDCYSYFVEKKYRSIFSPGDPNYFKGVKKCRSQIVTVCADGSGQNQAPVSNAGEDQNVAVGGLVELNGTSSADPDGDSLTFLWEIVSKPTGSIASLDNPTSETPSFTADLPGEYILHLVVNDGELDSQVDEVKITTTNQPPIADAGPDQTAFVGDTVSLDGTGSTDPEGSSLNFSWEIVSKPVDSLAELSSTSVASPTLVLDYAGTYTLRLVVNDGQLDSEESLVTITTINRAPTAQAGADVEILLGETANFDGSSSSDPDGDTLNYSWIIASAPSGNTAVLVGEDTSTPSFTPDAAGVYQIELAVTDSEPLSATDTLVLTVIQPNRAPTATPTSETVDEDNTLSITLEGEDLDGDALTFSVDSNPANGTLSGTAPNLTYTPGADFNGTDSFQFIVNDGEFDSAPATVSITVNPINDPPVSQDLNYSVDEDSSVATALFGSDIDSPSLSFGVVSGPANGVLSGTAPNLTYTPNADFNGADSFTYQVGDGVAFSDVATVSITVNPLNDAPTADAIGVSVDEDGTVAVTLTGADIDGDSLTFNVLTQPTNGTLTGVAPNLTYTPNADFNGADSFTFEVNDGTVSSQTETVSITVNPVNDSPVADAGSVTTDEDVAVNITLSGSDTDGDALTFNVLTQPANGTLTGTAPNLTYTPGANFNGSDSFTFEVSDGTASSVAETVSITVNPINDAPNADAASININEDGSAVITLTGTDVDGDTLTFNVLTQPANGTLTGTAPNLTYTPNADFNGTDSFTFEVSDGTVSSVPQTVTVTVAAVNDAPVADAQSVNTDEDTAVSIVLTGADVDGDSLTFNVLTQPANGVLTGTAPNLTYTPSADFNGTDSFTFEVNDGILSSAPQTVSIVVAPINDAPTADPASVSINEDGSAIVTLTGSDPDGDTLTFNVLTPPANGVLTGTAPNLTYTPNSDFNGTDSFTFEVTDGTTSSSPQTVTITITAINDAPTADALSITLDEDSSASVTLTGADVDGDTISFTVLTQPVNGVLTGTAPNLTYTPSADFNGTDSFTYITNDGVLDSQVATVSITVNPVNDAPIITSSAVLTANVDELYNYTVVATDIDDVSLTFSLDTAPAGMTIDSGTGLISWTPGAADVGTVSVVVRVEDGSSEADTQSFDIQVVSVPQVSFRPSLGFNVAAYTSGATVVEVSNVRPDSQNRFAGYRAINPFDNNSWRTEDFNKFNQFITIELAGGNQVIDHVIIDSPGNGGIKDFEVLVSTTGLDVADFTSVVSGTVAKSTEQRFDFPPVEAKYVKLFGFNLHDSGNTSSQSFKVRNFEVYGRERQGGAVSYLESGASIVFASDERSGKDAEFAIDTQLGTAWEGNLDSNDEASIRFTLDNGQTLNIYGATLDRAFASDGAPNSFSLSVSGDDVSYSEALQGTANGNSAGVYQYVFEEALATFVELKVLSVNSNASYAKVRDFHVYSPDIGGATVPFDSFASDADGTIVSYAWDFGDGNTSTDAYPVHTYASSGTYLVTLIVTDNDGNQTQASRNYTVLDAPTFDIVVTPDPASEGAGATLEAVQTSGAPVVSFVWTATDGSTLTGNPVSHPAFADSGLQTVTLSATDINSIESVIPIDISVDNVDPVIDAGDDIQTVWGEEWTKDVIVSDASSIDEETLECLWDFGDGQTQTVSDCKNNPSLSYAHQNVGSFTVTVTVTDKDGGSSTDSFAVEVGKRDAFISLEVVGATDGVGNAIVQGRLHDKFEPQVLVANETIQFALDAQSDSALTDASGAAQVTLQFVANVTNSVSASFSGNALYNLTSTTYTFGATSFPGTPTQPERVTSDSQGKEFFIAYPQYIEDLDFKGRDLKLLVFSENSTFIKAEGPGMVEGESYFDIQGGEVTEIVLDAYAYERAGVREEVGIRVSSPTSIQLHVVQHTDFVSEGYLALPSSELGQEYYAVTYDEDVSSGRPGFLIVGVEDNTNIEITNTADSTVSNHTIDRLETFMVEAPSASDVTGSRVVSDKPITFISTHGCTNVGGPACNGLAEQMMPVSTISNNYLTVPFANHSKGTATRVVATADNTEVFFDGVSEGIINDGEFLEVYDSSYDYAEITSTNPVVVAQFSSGNVFEPGSGDPSMTQLIPTTQFVKEVVFGQISDSTFERTSPLVFDHYINVITKQTDISSIRLDGLPMNAVWTPIGASEYAGTQVMVSKGIHRVTSVLPNARLMVYSYGYARADAYSYPISTNLNDSPFTCDLTSTVSGDGVDNDCDDSVDEELGDGIDNDGDGLIDEDLAAGQTAVNVPPIAFDGQTAIGEDSSRGILLSAFDANLDPLTFQIESAPSKGQLVGIAPNLVYVANANQTGADSFTFSANDGALQSNTATITIELLPQDDPPAVTSTPLLTISNGQVYSYDVDATDPDGDTNFTFSLLQAPIGMTIEPISGLIDWLPHSGNIGFNDVVVQVTDSTGASGSQVFQVEVLDANVAPSFSSTPVTSITAGNLYTYAAAASDPNLGDIVSFSLDTSPAGMTVDSASGLVSFQTTALDVGSHPVVIRASDQGGAFDLQSFALEVLADVEDPALMLDVSPNILDPGEEILVIATATDNVEVTNLVVLVDGSPVTLDGLGQALVQMDTVGTFTVEATATDAAGNMTTLTEQVFVRDPADNVFPVVSIDSPLTNIELTAPEEVRISVTEANLYEWTLTATEIGSFANNQEPIILATGNTELANQVAADFDPTLLTNGLYELELEAIDLNGQIGTDTINIRVDGEMKVGNFTITFVDLSIPLSGIPITVTRTYDTRVRNQELDFGFGWTVGYQAMKVSENKLPGRSWNATTTGGTFPTHCVEAGEETYVAVTLPDGDVEEFDLSFDPPCQPLIPIDFVTPVYTPRSGTSSKLEWKESYPLSVQNGEIFDPIVGTTFNPSEYILTTKDGMKFEVTEGVGIRKLTDTNQNILTFTDAGIFHSDGKSILFTRDGQNRITEVVAPDGTKLIYTYDGAGDLISVEDQENHVTNFVYGTAGTTSNGHYLTDIIDPRGETPAKMVYDNDGRLTKSIDALGNEILYNHDISGRQEVVTNRRGHTTVYVYDNEGNVLTMTDAKGGVKTYTYDAEGNELTVTDENLNTVTKTYDANNNVTSETDGLGRVTTFDFDTDSKLLKITDDDGNETNFTYDGNRNLLTITDDLGNVTTNTYDTKGRLKTITDAEMKRNSV